MFITTSGKLLFIGFAAGFIAGAAYHAYFINVV